MVTVEKRWPGSTFVLLGSGPSLTPEDVDFCRGKARVIAINSTVQLAPWADVLYSSDLPWWKFYKGVPEFAGLKYAMQSGKAKAFDKWPEIQVLANTGVDGVERAPHGLRTIHNSGGAAINLAIHLGATRILLLGYDMDRRGKQAHYFGNHPDPLKNRSPFPMFRAAFATMVLDLRKLGVQVLNCSRSTALTCFPCADLREALKVSVAA